MNIMAQYGFWQGVALVIVLAGLAFCFLCPRNATSDDIYCTPGMALSGIAGVPSGHVACAPNKANYTVSEIRFVTVPSKPVNWILVIGIVCAFLLWLASFVYLLHSS